MNDNNTTTKEEIMIIDENKIEEYYGY